MIVVDSSALIAILEHEVDAALYARAIEFADRLLISAVNVHETGVVLRIRRGLSALDQLWRFVVIENDFEIAPFDESQGAARSVGVRPLRQGHSLEGAPQPCGLRGLCLGVQRPRAAIVQGRRFLRDRPGGMSLEIGWSRIEHAVPSASGFIRNAALRARSARQSPARVWASLS
jgi:predicted nucleic acid-binding protein